MTTGEITPIQLEAQFKNMTLKELCFESYQLAEILSISPDDDLLIQLQEFIKDATEEKIDGYAWAADYLKAEIEEWKAKKDKLTAMCNAIIQAKENQLLKMKEGLIYLNTLGLLPDYLMGKTKAIEIRDNPPKVSLHLAPEDNRFPDAYKRRRDEWVANKEAILEAYQAGKELGEIASVTVERQVRFKNAPKRRKLS